MNAINTQRSEAIARVQQILLATVLLFSPFLASAQVATIDLSAERDFVYQDGVYSSLGESILPFVVTVHNPGTTTINAMEFTVELSANTSVGNVDSECIVSEETLIVLTCSIDELKANRTKIVDFFVDGPNSLGVGEGFAVSISSNDATVLEPDTVEATLADGDRRIRGSNLFVHLVRNIDLDINQNTVPDLDEAIMNLPASTPIDELLAREAVVDVLFIYTPAASQYLGQKLEARARAIISSANQTFRENDVAIKFKSVGLEEIPYTAIDTVILTTFDALLEKTDPAFDELDNLIITSGGDIVVMLHAVDTNVDPTCGWTTLNGTGRQGDFQSLYHQGNLLSAINVGPDCLFNLNMAPVFASNMGIARERQRSPDGGTFSFSAGYGILDGFLTLGAAIGTPSFGSAFTINRFSNPNSLCLGVDCGVDRNDVANGADAVYSLNKTRHLVSAITPTIFHVEPSAIEDKIAVLGSVYDLNVVQTSVETSAIINEFTEFVVNVTNTSSVTLSDIDIQLAHVNTGSIVEGAQYYETSSSLCTILGSKLSAAAVVVGDAIQKTGTLNCTIESIAPGASLSFNYRIQIDSTPPLIDSAGYYHEVVEVNGNPQLESLVCIPVFPNFVNANAGSSVCGAVQNLPLTFGPQSLAGLEQVATVTGNRLSVPFIRLDDGSLISAEFQITFFGEVRFELLSYQTLDSSIAPFVEARFTDAGVLSLPNLLVGGLNYDIDATLEPGSDPVKLGALNITALVSNP
ncbi:MAG: hypothetical protein COB20_02870 [SAR86 cluster bacterium]|uniref:Uncharacterized protein n=1 Tax=SAR86 cluster bacterium TaxID=2030880 RepID=A0A2A4XDE0_9GAMM|nr:MAG: hypothetical protein COB20_02870 [SAR86 cluster bacterium]